MGRLLTICDGDSSGTKTTEERRKRGGQKVLAVGGREVRQVMGAVENLRPKGRKSGAATKFQTGSRCGR